MIITESKSDTEMQQSNGATGVWMHLGNEAVKVHPIVMKSKKGTESFDEPIDLKRVVPSTSIEASPKDHFATKLANHEDPVSPKEERANN